MINVANCQVVKLYPQNSIAVDWAVADMLAVRQGSIGHIRYILKNGLRWFPLYGFYFRQVKFYNLYIRRKNKFYVFLTNFVQ